jgi:alkylation response protein AidB-like acyl-CoA dehydrogenase
MRFTLTEEQQLIQASAQDWLAGNYGFRQREAGVHRDGGAPAAWSAFADMGWLGLPLGEDAGGSGAGLLEAGLLMQSFGRHLVVEPFHACVLQAARVLELAGTPQQKSRWLPSVIEGNARLALVHAEPGDALPWSGRRTVARREGSGWRIEGSKQLAIGAPAAAQWIVSASGPESELLFLVDPKQDGVASDCYDTSEGGRAADLRFDGATLGGDALLGPSTASITPLLHRVLAEGVITQCWEATGAMQAVLEQTTQYVQQRKQFGQALSSFQVVQHRLAEMAVHCAEAQAACELATMRIERDADAGPSVAAMAKNKVGRAARYVAQEAVQLHGAMGVCEELPVAATFRMLLAFGQKNGDAASHAAQLGAALLAGGGHAHSQTLGMRA